MVHSHLEELGGFSTGDGKHLWPPAFILLGWLKSKYGVHVSNCPPDCQAIQKKSSRTLLLDDIRCWICAVICSIFFISHTLGKKWKMTETNSVCFNHGKLMEIFMTLLSVSAGFIAFFPSLTEETPVFIWMYAKWITGIFITCANVLNSLSYSYIFSNLQLYLLWFSVIILNV